MVYKALENIGEYKVGDTVPDNLAIVWSKMYKVSPVEFVAEQKPVEVEAEVKPQTTKKKKR